MPFRSIVAEPEDLAVLCAAFDRAWIAINQGTPIDPLMTSAARERLGHILIGFWKVDPMQDLAAAAIHAYRSARDFSPVSAPDIAQVARR
jgi:hypothetical protein